MNEFYYLSIPKTGNYYFKQTLLNPLKTYLTDQGIPVINFGDHEGWGPVKENTYTVCILRDPVKRIVGHFCHEMSSVNTLESFLNQKKNNLFEWIDQNSSRVLNFQSKNILYSKSENLRGTGWINMYDPDFIDMDIDIELLKSRIGSIPLLINSSSLNFDFLNNVLNKILLDFGLPQNDVVLTNYSHSGLYGFSQNLYNSLSASEKDYLYQINNIDSEIYNTSKYFVV